MTIGSPSRSSSIVKSSTSSNNRGGATTDEPVPPLEYFPMTEDRRDPRNTRKNKGKQLYRSAAGRGAAHSQVWRSTADIGTSNRTGTRFGPRQIRNESVMVRPYCMATGAAPFDSFQVGDIGDGEAGIGDGPGRATARDQFPTERDQPGCEVGDPRLVENREQCTARR